MRARVTAVSISVLAHAGVVAAFAVGLPLRDPQGAVNKGLQGIEVMVSAGGAKTVEPSMPPPESAKPLLAEQPVTPPQAPPQPAPDTVTSRDTAPELVEAPKPALKPRPAPKLKPLIHQSALQPVAAAAPVSVATPVQQQTKVAATPVPAAQGQVGQRDAPGAGNGTASSSGGNPGAEADYFAVLSAWLERHKEYPWRAQRRHSEGVAYLQFVVGRDGTVLGHRIRHSSGHRILDEAVERMIEKAAPLPPIPAEIGRSQLEIIVPVEFYLK